MFFLVLLAGIRSDTKILDTPDRNMGPEPCIRTCTGIDRVVTGWYNSGVHLGKVYKDIDMTGCDFVSSPVVIALSGGNSNPYRVCPSFTIRNIDNNKFKLYSVSDFTSDEMRKNECKVFWTATGFAC